MSKNIAHPLTDDAAVELWDAIAPNFNTMTTSQMSRPRFVECIKAVIRDAFDAGRERERTTNPAADADRPWEPLNGPVRVGDEVRQEGHGLTMTAVVGRVGGDGDPWTAEGALIGLLCHGTWYVRRPAKELPTKDGAILIPAEGFNAIESKAPSERSKSAHYVLRLMGDRWYGDEAEAGVLAAWITPGTWRTA